MTRADPRGRPSPPLLAQTDDYDTHQTYSASAVPKLFVLTHEGKPCRVRSALMYADQSRDHRYVFTCRTLARKAAERFNRIYKTTSFDVKECSFI